MSKVYVLTAEYCDNKFIEGVFSSFAAMITHLKDTYSFESDVEDQDELGAYFSKYYTDGGVDYFLYYSVKDIIGETSHKTDKLVVKSTQIFQGLKETKNEF